MSTTSNRVEPSATPRSADDQPTVPVAEVITDRESAFDPDQHEAPHRSTAAADLGAVSKAPVASKKAATRWAWNVPLLLLTLAVVGIGAPVLVGLYYWQSSRIGGQLLQLADHAAANNNPQEEVQWLRRYLAIRSSDRDAQVRMALTFDDDVQQWTQLDQARRYLTSALVAVEDQDDAVEDELRHRLIERMLQLGGGWLLEAERQIIKLNPPPADPEALVQMARSLVGQLHNQVSRSTPADVPEPDEHYWHWLAAQPVGDVLKLAVAASPDSVELADAFLGAALTKPELFAAGPGGTPDLREQINHVIDRLSQRTDSGHAQWTAYFYTDLHDTNVKIQPLAVAASAALQRLQEHAASFDPAEAAQAPLQIRRPGDYMPFWDAQLVLTHAANLAGGQAFDAAKDLYQSLAALPKGLLPPTQAERIYLGLGQSYWQGGNRDSAREAWSAGNSQLGGDNLILLESLATSSIELDSVEDARRNLERYAKAIEAASLRLAQRRTMSPAQRDELQKNLNTATWRIDVFRAHLDFREGNFPRAAQRLERAVASQLTIDETMRIEASELLAAAYGEQGLWDLAGRVLDAAALLDPSKLSLKKRAAAAWYTASASTRAAEQWQRADDGSFEAALAYSGALASSIASKAPAQRDYKPLLAALNTAQQRLDQLAAAGEETPADAWRLAMLSFALPAGVGSSPAAVPMGEDAWSPSSDGASKLKELVDLSLQYPQAAQLQAITTVALQRAGQATAAEEAYQRLTALSGVDPLLVIETQTRKAVERGGVDEAVELLWDNFNTRTVNRLRLAKFAATFLQSLSRPADAVALLMKLDTDEHDPQSLLQLGELLLALQQNLGATHNESSQKLPVELDVAAELQKVENAIRKLEGDGGTHWRFLAAERLLQQQDGDVAQKRLRLTEAAVLHSEIVNRRPRWSRALALGGRIAAEQGDARKAVDLLRRALAEGDKEAATVLLLVRQLNQTGDVVAAERELERLENWTDSVGQVSVMSVGLALAQGKNQSALERARAGVAARSSDAAAYVVLAQAAAAVARMDAEQAEDLHNEAEQALQQAQQLTRGRDVGVWQTQFRFQSQARGRAAGRKVLEAMQQSALPASIRSLAVANGYLILGDLELARDWFVKAKQANPADANVALAQANLFRTMNNHEALLAALEEAHQLAPGRQDIRRQLAVTLASQSASDDHWSRIRDLIGTDQPGASESDRLYHALLLISRSDQHLINQARDMLETMVQSVDPVIADDATRLMLAIERSRWESATTGNDSEEATAALEASERLYKRLISRSQPSPVDIYGYGELLLRADQTDEAQAMAAKLNSIAPANRGTLDLRLRVAKQTGHESEYTSIIDSWLRRQEGGKSPEAYAIVGQVMVSLDLTDQAVDVLRGAYQTDPAQLHNYVAALARADQYDRAVAVCLERFEKVRSPEPVALLADVMVEGKRSHLIDDAADHVFNVAAQEFSMNLKLLEAIGTLRLSQQRYSDAVELFAQAEKLSSVSLVTLNNMAVALAEISGRQGDALVRIERAIDLYGRDPELLDTLGTVQRRAGDLQAAEASLREAYATSSEPRHLLHLVLVLDARQQAAQVRELWDQLDLKRVDTSVLSPKDQKQLENLKKQLETSSAI